MILRILSLAGLVVMVAAVALLFHAHALLGESPLPLVIQALSLGLMVWARVAFGKRSFHVAANPTTGGVVSTGPYGFIRHPIYAAALYFTWAGILSHLSVASVILGLCVIAGAAMRIVPEEKLVAQRYPEYAGYARRTKRIIPFLF